MSVKNTLVKRKSVRAFLNKEVNKDTIEKILEFAKLSPSSTNMQPWDVHILSKNAKKNLDLKLLEAFDIGIKGQMDYKYYPETWEEPYKSRRISVGREMYKILEIEREDKEGRRKQWRSNYNAFNAPVVMYFFIDSSLEGGSFLDYGMFLQSIMLLCVEEGLSCCPMGSLAEYPNIVRKELNICDSKKLLCGIAIGYEDTMAPINSFRTKRIEIKDFANFHE